MISLRLPSDLEQELTQIAKLESTTKTQIVKEALVLFIANLKQKRSQTPYSLGEDLFGVADGEVDTSSHYKTKLDEILHEKYSH